jgi:hypothetical protein
MSLWGETIRQIAIFVALAMALAVFSVPAIAMGALAGSGGVDILGEGIFETGDGAFRFSEDASANYDSLEVGSDSALAIGGIGQIGIFSDQRAAVTAQNNLKIKKNQDSGDCECCQALDPSCPCKDCCTKVNLEQVKVGSRSATAIGLTLQGGFPFTRQTASTLAQNNVEIVTNQQ